MPRHLRVVKGARSGSASTPFPRTSPFQAFPSLKGATLTSREAPRMAMGASATTRPSGNAHGEHSVLGDANQLES